MNAARAIGFALALAMAPAAAHPNPIAWRAAPVVVPARYMDPDFWVARVAHADAPLLDAAGIAARNAALLRRDPSLHDLASLPSTLPRAQVTQWLAQVSRTPSTALFDAGGTPMAGARLDAIVANAALDAVPAQVRVRDGLVVRRAALRSFPTRQRVFSDGDLDIDRFQESALLPMTPVAIVHESHDHAWWFVVAPDYAAWVEKSAIAEGTQAQVLAEVRRPARLVTGALVRTAVTPEAPMLSDLPLDMGVRLPAAPSAPDQPVNGQHSVAAWRVQLPVRDTSGQLVMQSALIPRTADTRADNLPLTRANIIRQAFKFLGERYGWGGDYGTRDCSGFVAAVFASMGVVLPRNTSDQARNPVDARVHLADADATRRAAAIAGLRAGDLVYIPGHVMLVVGRIGDEPYVIHDIHDGKIVGGDGHLQSLHFNGVVVTPLRPLRLDANRRFVDAVTDIVHMAGPVVARP